jgi:Outer membrane protein beta-barrel family
MDFRSSYNYAESKFLMNQNSFKQYSFPGDSISEMNTDSKTRNNNNNHRVNARWEFNIDSANSILYTASFGKQESNNLYADTFYTASKAVYEYLALTGNTGRNDIREGLNYNGELLFRHRFGLPGRTFTFGWRRGYNKNESDNNSFNPITTFNNDNTVSGFININQLSDQLGDGKTNVFSSSYTEPMGKNKLLEFNYAYSGSKSVSDRKTFDYNTVSGKYDIVNLYQTNYFEFDNISHRLGSNFRVQKKSFNYQLGMAVQRSELESRSLQATNGKDTTIYQEFMNLFPSFNFNYNLGRSKSIRFFYRGRTNAPSIQQLQDIADYSNPLQIKTGNPGLDQEFINNFNIGYNSFNQRNFRFFSTNITFNSTANKIVNTIDSSGMVAVIMKPENANGSFNSSGMFTFGLPFKKMRSGSLNLMTMAYYSRDINLIYKKRQYTNILMLNQTIGYTLSKPKFDLGISGSIVYNEVKYTFKENSNTTFFKQTWSADLSYRFKNDFFLLTDMDYHINTGRTDGFNQDIFLWNMAIAKHFLKTKAAEIKLTAYDLLNQSKGINRTVNENYFEDTRANVVPRFFLISFTYNLQPKALRKPAKQSSGVMSVFQ